MPISREEFEEHHQAMRLDLPQRVLRICAETRDALTVRDVAARLLGIRNCYLVLLSQDVADLVPVVAGVLDQLVSTGKLSATVITRPPWPAETYYASVSDPAKA